MILAQAGRWIPTIHKSNHGESYESALHPRLAVIVPWLKLDVWRYPPGSATGLACHDVAGPQVILCQW